MASLPFALLIYILYLVVFSLCFCSITIYGNICVGNVEDGSPTLGRLTTEKKRWAIVALTKPGKPHTRDRNEALARVISPYTKFHDITVIFFSEVAFPPDEMSAFSRTFSAINVKVLHINTAKNGFNEPVSPRYGYKIDSDCTIESLSYDVFRWAEDNNLGYGFALRKVEAHGPTRSTLPVFTKKYMNKCGISGALSYPQMQLSTCFNFYNNFHIGRVSFFQRADVKHYLQAVNKSGNILAYRWGDSTIQAYAVRLFLKPAEVRIVPNFTYSHGSHGMRVTTFNMGKGSTVPQRLPEDNYD